MNLTITIVGLFGASKLLKQIGSYCDESNPTIWKNIIIATYWSTGLVCGIVHIGCNCGCLYIIIGSLCGVPYVRDNFLYYYDIQASIPLAFILAVCVIIEPLSSFLIVKDFKLRDSKLCCCNNCKGHVVRVIHTIVICNILWFLHRVGCGLLVAIFFIALAPAQTLGVISLIFFVIVCTIAYVAYNIYYINKMKCCTKESWKTAGELFILFVLYLCIVITLVCLTILFSELAVNGLTASGLGSIVLSLVAPTIVFIFTLQLKPYLEKLFIFIQEQINKNIDYDKIN